MPALDFANLFPAQAISRIGVIKARREMEAVQAEMVVLRGRLRTLGAILDIVANYQAQLLLDEGGVDGLA